MSTQLLAKTLAALYGCTLSWAVALGVGVVVEDNPIELFPMDQPVRFFVLLVIIALLGAGGRLLVKWDRQLPIPQALGSLMLAVAVAANLAFLLWGRLPLTEVMGVAGATAALGGEVTDRVLRLIVGRIADNGGGGKP